MAAPKRPSSSPWAKRFDEYKEKLLQPLFLGIPLAVLAKLNEKASGELFEQPWQAIWFLVPIALAAYLLRQRVVSGDGLYLNRRLLTFLGAYILLFSVASQASFLDLSRELTAFGTPASRRWLTPVSWGDWRYRLIPRKSVKQDELLVVLLPSGAGRSLVDERKDLIDLIAIAAKNGAKGVALDVYFKEPSAIDPLLCQAITTAAIPVFVGFGFGRTGDGHISESRPPDTLKPCLTRERMTHLAGLLDFDLKARITPLFFRNDRTRPALGLAVARALSGNEPVGVPADGLLRFIAPAEDPKTVSLDDVRTNASVRELLPDRFVMAGEAERDSFDTVFGRKPGIVIHSYVVHSLRQAHDVRRHSSWLGLAVMLVLCYWLTAWWAAGVSLRRVLAFCFGATAVIVAIAVGSILVGQYWFDVIYPTTAVWLLLLILVGLRRALPTGSSSQKATRHHHKHPPRN